MSGHDYTGAPLDITTLTVLAKRAETHPIIDEWAFQPDSISPRVLELSLDATQYPESIEAVRLDIRWFEGGDYTIHYLEVDAEGPWQCRWDKHPKPSTQSAHFHPPPDAGPDVEPSEIDGTHHLDILFAVLEWVEDRIGQLHTECDR